MTKREFANSDSWKRLQKAMLELHVPKAVDIIVRHLNSQDEKKQLKGVELIQGFIPYFTPKMTHQMNEMIAPAEIKIVNMAKDYELDENAKPKQKED